MNNLNGVLTELKKTAGALANQSSSQKNAALTAAAEAIQENKAEILYGNHQDVEKAQKSGIKQALIDRLFLNEARIADMATGIKTIASLPDPIGKVKAGWTAPNGLFIEQITTPLGVAAIIYESRPNVTADAFAIAYKAGCPILLRGSSAALMSNKAITKAIKQGLKKATGLDGAVALADGGGREEIDEILFARGKIDVIIPRGGKELIRRVVENARVPVIETGEGNCHIYVESDFNSSKAIEIIINAKTQKPGACNAVETVLIHKDAVPEIMPMLARALSGLVELHCDKTTASCAAGIQNCRIIPANNEDWETEFLDNILAVKSVESIDEAIDHINNYGTGHSEAILTENLQNARKFCAEVDAACVYVNASTRFTDGGEFGFGAELGISTQKFHARGPMGLEALTSTKYRITGSGQIR
ncbi:MAG: glutamate-5-semialdehyde dehydrogenase [Spirochaetaceae bacterium]|nr:glutamate-5-semialdehyde dehydrogenase [Spirochaetaceae bacterium]